MILKLDFVDSKSMTMLANFVVKTKVRFFPNNVIYKKNAHPPRRKDPFHRQQVYFLYQPIGDSPLNPNQ